MLRPSFGSFGYFFMLDVVGITKFAYSMLTVLGYFSLFVGTRLYDRFFKQLEYWRLIMCEGLVGLVLAPLTFIFVFRLNVAWGIPDMALIIFSDVVLEILSTCFVHLPMLIIMSKICPKHIEATVFAFLAGVSNFR